MTTDEYLEKRKRTDPAIWMAEYQQQPVDLKGRLFNNLKLIDTFDRTKIEGTIAYVDVADQGADYTACAVLAVVDKHLVVVDYVFSKANTDITLPMIAEKLKKWNTTYCRVESNSMGAMFSRHLQRMVKTKILQVPNTTNKNTRIIMRSVFIQDNFQFYKNGTPECEQFIQNVMSFSKEGKNKNDDAPDCLAGLAIFAESMFRNLIKM
jgi:predicted phage terminase large subunit-like protein